MRHTKIFFAAFALLLSTSTFANSYSGSKSEKEPLSFEIEKILHGSDFISDDSFTAYVFFKVTGDNTISVERVNSPNREVNEYLMKRLENQKLDSSSWDQEKVYLLPVKIYSRK